MATDKTGSSSTLEFLECCGYPVALKIGSAKQYHFFLCKAAQVETHVDPGVPEGDQTGETILEPFQKFTIRVERIVIEFMDVEVEARNLVEAEMYATQEAQKRVTPTLATHEWNRVPDSQINAVGESAMRRDS